MFKASHFSPLPLARWLLGNMMISKCVTKIYRCSPVRSLVDRVDRQTERGVAPLWQLDQTENLTFHSFCVFENIVKISDLRNNE